MRANISSTKKFSGRSLLTKARAWTSFFRFETIWVACGEKVNFFCGVKSMRRLYAAKFAWIESIKQKKPIVPTINLRILRRFELTAVLSTDERRESAVLRN